MQFCDFSIGNVCLVQTSHEIALDPVGFNQKQDKMKLFYFDETGSQEIMKVLPQGGFLVPVVAENQKYVKIEANKLPSLFRM